MALAEHGAPLKEKLDWTTKSSRPTAYFLAHTMATAEVMIDIDLVCRTTGAIALIDHHGLLPSLPAETRENDTPFRATAQVKLKHETIEIGVVPDRLFSLVMPDCTRVSFALELDRGTMISSPSSCGANPATGASSWATGSCGGMACKPRSGASSRFASLP